MYLNSVIGQKIQYQLKYFPKLRDESGVEEYEIILQTDENDFFYFFFILYSLHYKRPKSTSSFRFLKIAKQVNRHDTYSNSFLNSKMKVLQLTVNLDFFAVLESGENSKKAIIIPYGPGNTTVPPDFGCVTSQHLKIHTIRYHSTKKTCTGRIIESMTHYKYNINNRNGGLKTM